MEDVVCGWVYFAMGFGVFAGKYVLDIGVAMIFYSEGYAPAEASGMFRY